MKKLIAAMLALIVCAVGMNALAEETKLSVSGTGVVSVLADQVSVTLGVTETNAEVKAAQEAVNAKINAIYDALIAAGVEKKDIGTDRISIRAEYSDSSILRSGGELTGYTASNTITINRRIWIRSARISISRLKRAQIRSIRLIFHRPIPKKRSAKR